MTNIIINLTGNLLKDWMDGYGATMYLLLYTLIKCCTSGYEMYIPLTHIITEPTIDPTNPFYKIMYSSNNYYSRLTT